MIESEKDPALISTRMSLSPQSKSKPKSKRQSSMSSVTKKKKKKDQTLLSNITSDTSESPKSPPKRIKDTKSPESKKKSTVPIIRRAASIFKMKRPSSVPIIEPPAVGSPHFSSSSSSLRHDEEDLLSPKKSPESKKPSSVPIIRRAASIFKTKRPSSVPIIEPPAVASPHSLSSSSLRDYEEDLPSPIHRERKMSTENNATVPSRRSSDSFVSERNGRKRHVLTPKIRSSSVRNLSSKGSSSSPYSGSENIKTWRPATDRNTIRLTGKEEYRSVLVYERPPTGVPLPFLEPSSNGHRWFQGVWASKIPQLFNPTELWLFHMEGKPPGLEGSVTLHGYWGFDPEVEVVDDDFDPEDLWVYPPGAVIPNRFEKLGLWIYPQVLADTSHIRPGTSGFVDLFKSCKVSKLDVGGMWKVLLTKEEEPERPKKVPKSIFQIKIMTGTGDETITLFPIKATETIWNIRCKLAKKHKGLPTDQCLVFEGEVLDDDVSLQAYNIGHNAILALEGMKLYIQHWDRRHFEIRAAADDTIAKTKERISQLINVPTHLLRLSFERALLSKNDGELKKYKVHHYARLRLEPIQLFVREANKVQVKVPVRPIDSVYQVKKRISQRLGMPLDTPRRLYLKDGTELLNGYRLMDYDTVEHGTLLQSSSFQIFIQHWSGEKYEVDVAQDATVGDVKFACLELKGIPMAHQNLYFNKTGPLDSSKTLQEYSITTGTTLSLLSLPPFEIQVQNMKNETVELIVDPTDPLEDLKKQVEDELGIRADSQQLMFRGRRIKGNLTLAEYGLKEGSNLEVFEE